MPRPIIVGLTGYAQSGKDTLANLLVEKRAYERRGFADPMRDMLLRINPLVLGKPTEGMLHPTRLARIVEMHGWEEAKQMDEVRSLLQRLGTEAGRGVLGEDVWVNALFAKPQICPLVISDVRFPNEAQKIHDFGGIVIRIIREGVGPVNHHASELENNYHDFVIHNKSDPEYLLEAYLEIFDNWFQKENV